MISVETFEIVDIANIISGKIPDQLRELALPNFNLVLSSELDNLLERRGRLSKINICINDAINSPIIDLLLINNIQAVNRNQEYPQLKI